MAGSGDPVQMRRLGGRVRAWLGRRWTRRGLVLLAVAALVLAGAGAIAEPWRWLAIADGSLLAWFALAAVARSPQRSWPRSIGAATFAYLASALTVLLAGTPAPLALAWPYVLAQAAIACPLGLPCPLGR